MHETSKRLEQMRSNPRGDWKIEDVAALCREFELMCEPPRGGGSHYKVGHPGVQTKLAIPFRRPIKPVYIKALVELVDAVRTLS